MNGLGFLSFLMKSLLFVLVLGSLAAASQTTGTLKRVQTEFVVTLPRSTLQEFVGREWENLQKDEFQFLWNLPDQVHDTAEVKVLLSGMVLEAGVRFRPPQLGVEGESVRFEAAELRAELRIKSIFVDQYIEREVGGVIGRFRIQARCEDVSLRLKPGEGFFAMRLSPVFEKTLLRAQVEEVYLKWAATSWEMGPLRCSGAKGFEELVSAEILKRAGDDSVIEEQKETLLKFTHDFVEKHALDFGKAHSLASLRSDIRLSLQVRDFEGTAEGARMKGVLTVSFARRSGNQSRNIKLSVPAVEQKIGRNVGLLLPEDFVVVLAQELFASYSWKKRVGSSAIPGFQSLMSSRRTQFFVWRELIKYPKSARFLFDVTTGRNPEVRGQRLRYRVKTALAARMHAPRGGGYVPFMDFWVPLSSQVNLQVERGRVRTHFQDVRLGLQGQWVPSYESRYRPFQCFAAEKIQDRIQQEAEGAVVSYKLPQIPLTEEVMFQIDRVRALPGRTLEFLLKAAAQ